METLPAPGYPTSFRLAQAKERFWVRVQKTDGCWLWIGGLNSRGYGTFYPTPGAAKVLGHRFAYELLVGPIPHGLTLDHLCKTPRCVRPDHLEAVTMQENLRRTREEACIHGHPFSGSNLYVDPNGRRTCRACRNASAKKRRAEKLLGSVAPRPPQASVDEQAGFVWGGR